MATCHKRSGAKHLWGENDFLGVLERGKNGIGKTEKNTREPKRDTSQHPVVTEREKEGTGLISHVRMEYRTDKTFQGVKHGETFNCTLPLISLGNVRREVPFRDGFKLCCRPKKSISPSVCLSLCSATLLYPPHPPPCNTRLAFWSVSICLLSALCDREAIRRIQQGSDKPNYFNPQSACLKSWKSLNFGLHKWSSESQSHATRSLGCG